MKLAGEGRGSRIESVGNAFASVYADVEAYYSARVARHGATPLGVDWSCQATQMLRFVQLLKICDFSAPVTLNDIGCGYGALAAFLAMRYPSAEIDYLGVDLSRAMVSRARRRFSGPDRRFVVRKASPRVADYSLASGIMNVRCGHSRATWEGFIATMLEQMRRTSRRGFSVNFVVDAPQASAEPLPDMLYRTTPQPWIRFCEGELGCSVETLDDYGMKEFTLLVRCDRAAGA